MKPIQMNNERELLQEVRDNNCREILTCEINITVGERTKNKYPAKMEEVQNFIARQKQRRDDLMEGVRVIDERLEIQHRQGN